MASVPEWLKKVFVEFSTDRFAPEYDEFKYNHMYQGIIALWQIGATDEQCRKYAEFHSTHLDPAEVGKERIETGHKLLPDETLQELLGKRTRYNDLLAHYSQRLIDLGNDIGLLLNEEFPKLAEGIPSGAFHGTIQIGYGYIVNDARLVCEGLAFLHFAYLPFVLSAEPPMDGGNDTDILDLLKEIKDDGQLAKFVDDNRVYFKDGRDRSKFVTRTYTLLTLKADELVKLANRIKLPTWFDKNNFDADQVRRLTEWILDCAIILYCQSEMRNNFYLIHGVTSAWAMCHIMPLITDRQKALRTLNLYLAGLLTAYISILCPPVSPENMSGLEPKTWEEIKAKLLENFEADEHLWKIVHVCQDRNSQSQDEDMKEIYRKAAQLVTYFKLTYV